MDKQNLVGKRVIARDPQGNLSPGEYTGICKVTGQYCVSFYNGYTKKYKTLKEIEFTGKPNE